MISFEGASYHLSKLRYKGGDSNLDFLHSTNLDKNSDLGTITIFRPDESRLSSRIHFLVLLMAGTMATFGGESKMQFLRETGSTQSESVTQTATSQRRRSDIAV